jgi:hypothetical protein
MVGEEGDGEVDHGAVGGEVGVGPSSEIEDAVGSAAFDDPGHGPGLRE